MARSPGNSLLNSLRGKIWISTSVLAFFICTFGLISYLVATLLTNDVFYAVFMPFIFLAFTVIAFGWWLSNELVNPIEKVILLSKSLERNSSTSIPKTSGSSETDQLLQTLHRNSQQMQNVVNLMDKVANGNMDVALTPLKGSDRLTASFQKLLSKVTESIHAKEELTKLESEIEQLKIGTSGVRNGNLSIDIKSDSPNTSEIAETIKYLIENLTLMISLIKVDSFEAQLSANDVEQTIDSLIKQDETKVQEMNQASITLKQVPNLIEKITENLTASAKSAKHTIDKARHGNKISQDNSDSVGQLRSKLREAVNRIQSLNERSHEIAKVAKTVEDLANRTNMIALNASIQATEFGEEGRSFVLVSEELERLAARANGTNKQISMLNNSILSEIGNVENALENTMGEVADLSKFAIETSNVLGELERYVGQYLNLQENLIAFSKDQSEETDEAFETFVSSISDTQNNIKNLEESSNQIRQISLLMKNLQIHTSEFRILPETEDVSDKTESNAESYQESAASPNDDNDDDKDLATDEFQSQEFTTDEFNAVKLDTDEFKSLTENSDEIVPPEYNSENSVEDDDDDEKYIEIDSNTAAEMTSKDSEEADFSESDSQNADSNDFNSDEYKLDADDLPRSSYDQFTPDVYTSSEINLSNISEDENSEDINSEDYFDDELTYQSYNPPAHLKDDLDIDEQRIELSNQSMYESKQIESNPFDDDLDIEEQKNDLVETSGNEPKEISLDESLNDDDLLDLTNDLNHEIKPNLSA